MVRILDVAALRAPEQADGRVASSTGRAVGAALACLMVTTLVVDRSIAAAHPGDAASSSAFTSASLLLSDDDQGRSLMNLNNMVPGRAHRSCISVTYEGTVFPVDLQLTADVTGSLGEYVSVSLDEIESDSSNQCDSAPSQRDLYQGSLAGLADQTTEVARLSSAEETRTYRFSFELLDTAAAMGRQAGADFVWEIDPS